MLSPFTKSVLNKRKEPNLKQEQSKQKKNHKGEKMICDKNGGGDRGDEQPPAHTL